MGSSTKVILLLCIAAVVGSLVYRADSSLNPALPKDMPSDSRFLQTGYDLSRNERRGQWVACHGAGSAGTACRITDSNGIVIFEGEFLAVRNAKADEGDAEDTTPASGTLSWVNGPVEGTPVPLIPMSDGSFLVPLADRGPLLDRWNQHPEEWRTIAQGHVRD